MEDGKEEFWLHYVMAEIPSRFLKIWTKIFIVGEKKGTICVSGLIVRTNITDPPPDNRPEPPAGTKLTQH